MNSFCAGESVGYGGTTIYAGAQGEIVRERNDRTVAAGSNSTTTVCRRRRILSDVRGARAEEHENRKDFFTTAYLSVCEIRSGCCASCRGDHEDVPKRSGQAQEGVDGPPSPRW